MTEDNFLSRSPKITVVYLKNWCPDCRRARKVLTGSNVPYQEYEISNDEKARAFVRDINKGNESVPTIIFPDGTILVEPGSTLLAEKLQRLKSLSPTG